MLFAVAAVVLVAVAAGAAAAALALGVGPFARGAAGSVVDVAISRSTDEAAAREREAIDLVAGTGGLVDVGGRIVVSTRRPARASAMSTARAD